MAVNSINTNIAAYYAQSNISTNSTNVSLSVSRLSSGNRIVRASDDVAALSIGTSLRTAVSTLKIAKINTAQGGSVLQVADGALAQLQEILQRQKAIAVQAGSGSLTDTERGFLDQEYQALTSEVDRLVSQTNFNGQKLLDGSLTEKVTVADTRTNATQATATLAFSSNPADSTTVLINGVTFTGVTGTPGANQFKVGATTEQTVANLAAKLNAGDTDTTLALTAAQKLAVGQATYVADGQNLKIISRAGGSLGSTFRVDMAGTATDTATEAGIGATYGGSSIAAFATGFTSATASLTGAASGAATPFQNGEVISVTLNGVAYQLGTVATGDSLQDIINRINANTANSGITADLTYTTGLRYNIRLSYNDRLNDLTTNFGANYNTTLGGALTAAGSTTNNLVYGLAGGKDDGLGIASTSATGTVGDSILTGLTQTKSRVVVQFPEVAPSDLTSTSNFGNSSGVNIAIGGVSFVFTTNTSSTRAVNEITVGATLEETLDNAVAVINGYKGVGTEKFQLDQLSVKREGRNLVFEGQKFGTVTQIDGTTTTQVVVSNYSTVSTTNSGNLSNGATGGIVIEGVTNADFIGTGITGFNASYTGTADTVDLSIKVGDYTYTAKSVDTTPTSATQTVRTVRLYSDTVAGKNGGYFDLILAQNQGTAVNSSSDASTFAARLDTAVSSLTFYQNRIVSNYAGQGAIVTDGVGVTGSLVGSKLTVQDKDFSSVKIDKVEVFAPAGSNPNGSLAFTVNGEVYTSAAIAGGKLGANQTYRLTSATDSNKFIEFTTGTSSIDFSTSPAADAFREALKTAIGVGDGSAALAFQVGATTADTLRVAISGVSTNALFSGATLDVRSQAGAQAASDALDKAIKLVTAVRADVGALQSRFNYAAANIEASMQNQDAARGELLDTDIASESTSFAISQVKLQAGISTLAQANQQLQSLLKLIG